MALSPQPQTAATLMAFSEEIIKQVAFFVREFCFKKF